MSKYSGEQLLMLGEFTPEDPELVERRRRDLNCLGYVDQVYFVHAYNCFPNQSPSLDAWRHEVVNPRFFF